MGIGTRPGLRAQTESAHGLLDCARADVVARLRVTLLGVAQAHDHA